MDELYKAAKTRRKAYCDTFKTESGKSVLEDLCKFSGAHRVSFVPGDPYSTAYKEGMRAMYLHITKIIGQSEIDLIKYKQIEER